jgi:hypothetical protein
MASAHLFSQNFVYKAGFTGFFDNREYFNQYVIDQTLFGSRIAGELGYAFNDHNRIMAGADYLYEFGSKGEWIAPDIIAFYHGKYKKVQIHMGAFPRLDKISMPLALLNDTLTYHRPNVEGILLEYHSAGFSHNIWIDWTGRQSLQKRETFLLGFSAFAHKGHFIYQHHFVMTHLAHSMDQTVEEHIRDNAAFSILPGLDFSEDTHLDSLTVSAGLLASYDRLRGIYEFRVPVGFMGEIKAVFRRFGLQGLIYAGEPQVITSGDGFYQSDLYCRADAFYRVSNPYLNGKLQLSLHFIPGVVDLSMSLVIRASIEGVFRHHQSN